jgi:hypothetical protein
VLQHRRSLDLAYRHVRRRIQEEADKRKSRFSKKVMNDPIALGEKVLLRNHPKGRCKIQNKWKEEEFVVENKKDSVYTVVNSAGQKKTIHRNELRRVPEQYNRQDIDSDDTEPLGSVTDENSDRDSSESSDDSDTWVAAFEHAQPVVGQVPREPAATAAEIPENVRPVPLPRRTPRATAGHHSNPHNLPRTAVRSIETDNQFVLDMMDRLSSFALSLKQV